MDLFNQNYFIFFIAMMKYHILFYFLFWRQVDLYYYDFEMDVVIGILLLFLQIGYF
jgi:hypothetical protein